MPEREVRKQIGKLQLELQSLPEQTGELEEKLKDAHGNFEQYSPEGIDALIDYLQHETEKLEVEHPQITALLNQVMTALSNWGI